jgi:hypothetical protein
VAAYPLDAPPAEDDAEDPEDVGQITAAGRVKNKALLEEPEQ